MKRRAVVCAMAMAAVVGLGSGKGVRADQAAVDAGKKLCETKKCAVCHKESSKKGKPLNQVTKGKTDEFLKGALVDPKKTIDPKTKMPGYKFTDEEVNAVMEYLKSLAAEQK